MALDVWTYYTTSINMSSKVFNTNNNKINTIDNITVIIIIIINIKKLSLIWSA